jgi:hypothetical protein
MATLTQTATEEQRSLTLDSQTKAGPAAPSSHKLPKARKVPVFATKEEERQWQKQQMAGAFRVFAKLGFADGVAGHMSLRGQ